MAQRQRKGTPPGQGGSSTIFYVVLGIIALGGILAIGYALTGGGGDPATELVEMDVPDVRSLYEQAVPVRLGDDAAPVKVVEFGDYQCPGCREFSLRHRPRVMPFIESGLAQFIYYDYPLGGSHVHSFLAARAARCAGEQELSAAEAAGAEGAVGTLGQNAAFWAYHDKIFREQPNWSGSMQPPVDLFVQYAEDVGLDPGAFRACLQSDRFADVVTANRMLGDELGVRGTPTVLVNNRLIGGRAIQDMGDALIEELRTQRAARAGTPGGADTSATGDTSNAGDTSTAGDTSATADTSTSP